MSNGLTDQETDMNKAEEFAKSEVERTVSELAHKKAKTEVCAEILNIMRVYHEQEERGNIGTPGGLEHMGDVWDLFRQWEAKLKQPD